MVVRSLMAGRARAMKIRGKMKSRDQPSDAHEPRKTPSIVAACQVTQIARATPRKYQRLSCSSVCPSSKRVMVAA